jgi:hypothetical protein
MVAYGSGAVVTHWDEQGVPTSSASAPGTVAGMLEQAQVVGCLFGRVVGVHGRATGRRQR